MPVSEHITIHSGNVTRAEIETAQGHRGGVVWLTGLSGSGKSTLARALERTLFGSGVRVAVLDGDNLRFGLNRDLGFSPADRQENLRRAAEVGGLLADAGLLVGTAFISPMATDRAQARAIVGADRFVEVFVHSDLQTCIDRDPKGLYRKALAGQIPQFTGVSAPYEAPEQPDLIVDTATQPVEVSVETVREHLRGAGFFTVDSL